MAIDYRSLFSQAVLNCQANVMYIAPACNNANTLDTQVRTHTTAGARTLRSRDCSRLLIVGQQLRMRTVGATRRSDDPQFLQICCVSWQPDICSQCV